MFARHVHEDCYQLVLLRKGTILLCSWRCHKRKLLPRLAPLSQGRIEPADSTLMCSYHGWRINGQGRAVSIPQAHFQNPVAEEAACNSNRSCVKAFPTAVCLCCTALLQLERSLKSVAPMSFAMQREPTRHSPLLGAAHHATRLLKMTTNANCKSSPSSRPLWPTGA